MRLICFYVGERMQLDCKDKDTLTKHIKKDFSIVSYTKTNVCLNFAIINHGHYLAS